MDAISASLVHDYLSETGFESVASELRKHRNVVDLQGVKLSDVTKSHEESRKKSNCRASVKMIECLVREVTEKVSMKSSFPELRKFLESPDCNLSSDVVKVMNYILNQDFEICRLDAMARPYSTLKLSDIRKKVQAVEPNFQLRQFTKESLGEESDEFKIRKEWNHLVALISMKDPRQCIKTIKGLSKMPLKCCQFVLGSYLSRTLNHVRPAQ